MKIILSLVLAAALLLGLAACVAQKKPSQGEETLPPDSTPEGEGTTAAPETSPQPEVKECESAESFAQNMTTGWNLGLALSYYAEQPKAGVEGTDRAREVTPESIDYAQTRWGNPLTTQEMINAVRDKGFNLIRVQVSYVTHMDHAGNIDELWLDRVAEVVDYCMNAGVYCLLTSTGAGWLEAERETFPEQSAVYRRMWEQISARFADYGELLLFEACNEVLNADKLWSNPPQESYDVMNELYQIFVDTVRAGGGYNTTRNLVLNPYAAAYEYNMNQNFKLPQDSTDGHLIAEVHCYEPNNFCFNETNLGSTNFTNEWGTKAERAKIEIIMKNLKRRFVEELGVPVIVGEFGVVDRADEDTRAQYIGHFAKMAEKYGVKLVIFDDGWDFTVFERTDLSWPYEKVIEALLTRGASVE